MERYPGQPQNPAVTATNNAGGHLNRHGFTLTSDTTALLSVDDFKVDRSFVRDMTTDRGNTVVVQSALDLGHNLGLAVVAEGVEDAATLDALHQLGCDVAQGFHFARPQPADQVTASMKRPTNRRVLDSYDNS